METELSIPLNYLMHVFNVSKWDGGEPDTVHKVFLICERKEERKKERSKASGMFGFG